jgi:hypothetical protein
VATGAILLVLIVSARSIVDFVVGRIYENVVAPNDVEMPLTVTSYPSSPHVVSIIGGKGEGLNCSLPWGIDLLFDRTKEPSQSPIRQRFRQACVFHDLCYRHGLATYGYSQSDCDQMLQEHAVRICLYASAHEKKPLSNCQLDAKKILAGVRVGGFRSFQQWRTSTYFEFDSSPSRSDLLSAFRVVDHPFKGADPQATDDDSDQLLLGFEIKRSGVTVVCRNCTERKFTTAELKSAALLLLDGTPDPRLGIPTAATSPVLVPVSGRGPLPPAAALQLPEELDELRLDQERPVWLPLGGINAAPHLMLVRPDHQQLVWLNREKVENTVSCAVVADPKNLLTHTRPRDHRCFRSANSWLKLASVEFNASSPQATIVRSSSAEGEHGARATVGVGLTLQVQPNEQAALRINQIVGALKVCVSPDLNKPLRDGNANCFELRSGNARIEHELGAFQNFPIMKGERQIYLSRPILRDSKGNAPGKAGRALIFDVGHRHLHDRAAGPVDLVHDRTFVIADDFDPMMPMTRDKNDLRLLSVKSSLFGKIGIHEVDLAADNPAPVPVPIVLRSGDKDLDLPKSWARRPVLVVASDPMNERQSKTQLFLSRSDLSTVAKQNEDSVRFQFIVLERSLENGKPILRYARGLNCKITYKFTPHPFKPCRRSSETVGAYHPAPAQMLQGAQLLVGRFKSRKESGRTPEELSVAVPDACFEKDPIILRPIGANESSGATSLQPVPSAAAMLGAGPQKIERAVACGEIKDRKQIEEELTDQEQTAGKEQESDKKQTAEKM